MFGRNYSVFVASLDSRYNSITPIGHPDSRKTMTDITRILNAIEQGDIRDRGFSASMGFVGWEASPGNRIQSNYS
jgi:hypothetical protein